MSQISRRRMIQAGAASAAVGVAGSAHAAPEQEKRVSMADWFLPAQLTAERISAGNGAKFTKHEHAGIAFWVGICDLLSDGVPHAWIGVYAPDQDGVFQRCLLTESWAAGQITTSVDSKTGMLELRESANSHLKGQIVLACNLKTIGTRHSAAAT